jgi:ribose transport system substrate-binding protein
VQVHKQHEGGDKVQHIIGTGVRRGRLVTSALALLGAAAIVAGCGSSDNGGGGSTGSGGTSDGASTSTQLKAARTPFPARFQGPSAPVKAPKQLTVAAITCSSQLSGCVSPATGLKDAAQALGWKIRVYDGGGTAAKQNAAMLDAVSAGADVIANIAIDPNLVQQGLRAAKRAGVMVVSGSNGIDTPNPVQKPSGGKLGYVFDVGPDYAGLGRKAADWIIGDSGGKANIAVFSDKEFPSVIAFQNGLLDGLKKCEGCTVSPLQYFSGTQVGTTLGSQTTGYLRSHPDVNYVFSPYDPAAAAQVTAIAQAGMANKIKLVGVLGSQQNLDFVRQGQVQAADAAYDNRYMGYMIADGVIRTMAKKPLFSPHGGNMPYVVLDKSNLPPSGADWHASFDYRSDFQKLWQG